MTSSRPVFEDQGLDLLERARAREGRGRHRPHGGGGRGASLAVQHASTSFSAAT